MSDWAEDIDGCDRIWIRASVSNRRIFLDYEGAIIAKGTVSVVFSVTLNPFFFAGDDRLRTFPFPTRRPVRLLLPFHARPPSVHTFCRPSPNFPAVSLN